MTKSISSARADFPILNQLVNDHPLVYLDNAATAQKPRSVIDSLVHYYEFDNANIHRGNHTLAIRATEAHEAARSTIAGFINAQYAHEIVFTRGTTESINLVAYSFGEAFVKAGDEIIVTELEHHSNYVPWFLLCKRKGATFRVVPFDQNGELDLEVFKSMLSEKTRLVAVNHVSNSLGTVNPISEIIQLAHQAGVPVLVTPPSQSNTLTMMFRRLTLISTPSPAIKYTVRPVSACFMAGKWLEEMPPFLSGGK